MRWNTSEKCGACGSTGCMMDAPIYAGECAECDEPCCEKCGHTDHDMDGTRRWCKPCYRTVIDEDFEPAESDLYDFAEAHLPNAEWGAECEHRGPATEVPYGAGLVQYAQGEPCDPCTRADALKAAQAAWDDNEAKWAGLVLVPNTPTREATP